MISIGKSESFSDILPQIRKTNIIKEHFICSIGMFLEILSIVCFLFVSSRFLRHWVFLGALIQSPGKHHYPWRIHGTIVNFPTFISWFWWEVCRCFEKIPFGPMDGSWVSGRLPRLRPFELYTVSCAWLLRCWYIPTTFGRPRRRVERKRRRFGEAAKPGGVKFCWSYLLMATRFLRTKKYHLDPTCMNAYFFPK